MIRLVSDMIKLVCEGMITFSMGDDQISGDRNEVRIGR